MTVSANKILGPSSFARMKKKGQKITMITAYDYPGAKSVSQTGVEIILVGDSLGNVILGYDGTIGVTMDDMVVHSAAVRRGAPSKFVVTDMPYMSYHVSAEETKRNAARLVLESGANAVKLEGGSQSRLDAIKQIVDIEIPVCAHLGLTPQSVLKFGGYKVQGKGETAAEILEREALAVQEAGAFMLVLEAIPEELAKKITRLLDIPTIGIGAGRYCDGQVLVYHDMLGHSNMRPKFVKQYANLDEIIVQGINDYDREVKDGTFPSEEYIYYPTGE